MSIKSKIKHLLFLVLFSSLFVGELFSQNFLNFDLDYVDYSGSITGNVGDTVTIPVQAIFFQDEGYCDGQEEECSAFLVNSLDPSIDIDYTIRELQNVEFNDFGGGNLNNDFFGNNGVGFEDLLTSFEIWPPDSSITNCDYTPVPGSQAFFASNICSEDVVNLNNNIGQFVVELTANLPTLCDDAPSDGINDDQAFWFLQFNLYFPDELSINLTSSESCGFNTTCNGSDNGELTAQVSGGVPPYNYVWTDQDGNIISNSQTASNLSAGFYTVTVTDDADDLIFDSNGDGLGVSCSETFEITEPEEILITLSEDEASNLNLICNGDCDGSIFIDVAGGCPPYNFSWSNGESTEDLNNLCAGSYNLTVIDENGCSEEITVEITEPDAITITETSSDYNGFGVSCNGDSDGSIDITVEGGVGLYSYAWSNSETTEDLSNLVAGTYTLTVTDENGCSEEITVEITEPDAITVTEISSDYNGFGVSCNGASDGSIDITVEGGTETYSYAWSNSETTEDLSNLGAGTYSLTVTDENGCSEEITVEITEPDVITISETHSDYNGFGVSCNGSSDGSIDITVDGGVGVYLYTWSSGQNSEDLNDIGAGTYTLTVTDENGCSEEITVEITEPDAITITGTSSDYNGFGVSCNGDSDGSIDITVEGGVGLYSYAWSNSETTEDLFNLSAGTYTLTVTDENGCSEEITVEITEPDPITITVSTSDYNGFGVSCNGATDGFIDISAEGGVGDFLFNWSVEFSDGSTGGATSEDLNESNFNVGAGTYNLTVVDENGCSEEITVEITEPDAIEILFDSIDDLCFGACNGSIDVNPIGGTLFYSYNWTGPDSFSSSSQNIANLCPGTYTLLVTDSNNCSESIEIDINQEELINTSVDIIPPQCSGYTACVTLESFGGSGANYSYEFYIDNSNEGPQNSCNPEDEDILFDPEFSNGCFNLNSGSYYVTTTDENGCCVFNTFTIVAESEVSVDINEVPDCYPNESFLILSGWNPPLESYNILIFDNDTDNDGLDNILSNNIPLDDDINNINGPNSSDNDIDGDGILNDDDFIDLDGNGVFNFGDVNTQYLFSNPPLYDFVYDQQADIDCGDFLGGVWDGDGDGPGTCNEFPLVYDGGSTVVLIISESGCFNFQIVSNDNDIYLPIESTNEVTNTSCFGETNDIGDSDSDDLDGDNCLDDLCSGSITINISEPGNYVQPYTIYVTDSIFDANGVLIYESLNSDNDFFDENDSYPLLNIGDPDDDNDGLLDYEDPFPFDSDNDGVDDCIGPNYDCDNDGILNDGDPDSDNDGILNEDDDLFGISDLIPDSLIYIFDSNNGLVSSDTDGDGDLDQLVINNLCPGQYLYVIQDVNGCESIPLTFEVFEAEELIVSAESGGDPAVLCNEEDSDNCYGFVDVTVSGGTPPYTYSWSNGDTIEDLTNLCAGTYELIVTDSNGCCEVIERTIEEIPEILISINEFTENIDCNGNCNGIIDIDISGGTEPYIFNWTGPNNFSSDQLFLDSLCAGTYFLQGFDSTIDVNGNNCSFFEEFIINEPEEISINFDVVGSCFNEENGAIDLTVTGGTGIYTYSWSNGDTSEDLNNLAPGTYTITVIDENSCTQSEEIEVIEFEELIITETHSDYNGFGVSCNGAIDGFIDITVTGGSGIYTYLWSSGQNTEDLNNIGAGTYTLTVTDENGCFEEIIVEITEPDAIIISETHSDYSGFGVSCNGATDGFIDIVLEGGVGEYTYSWSSGQNTEDLNNIGAGTYTVTATDEKGCQIDITVEITEPDELTISETHSNYSGFGVSCNGATDGSIDITVNGGTGVYTYLWSSGQNTET